MSDPVYEQLRTLILSDNVGPDTVLAQTSLASRLGVSRTPIREALRRLEQDGLVERTSRGVRVVVRSPEQILEIYEVRILLEAQAARTAVERATSLDLNRLRVIHEQAVAAEHEDDDGRARLNRLFHQALWAASHNSALLNVIEHVFAQLHSRTPLSSPGRWERILTEHGQLLQAITDRRADDAAAIATEHMTRTRDAKLEFYAALPATGRPDEDHSQT
jgi:DNA-binding GntR family transcriptional regulator